jgi:hypothetical protein
MWNELTVTFVQHWVRFQVLTAVLWDIVPYILLDIDRRFRESYGLNHHGVEWRISIYTKWRNILEDNNFCVILLALSMKCVKGTN